MVVSSISSTSQALPVRGVRRNRDGDYDDHRDKHDADDRRLFLDPATGEKVGW